MTLMSEFKGLGALWPFTVFSAEVFCRSAPMAGGEAHLTTVDRTLMRGLAAA